jgi:hypothetical protein
VAYDAHDGYVVLFGGDQEPPTSPICGGMFLGQCTLNDTWKWFNGHWAELQGESPPPTRAFAGVAFDARLGAVIVFGGYHSNSTAITFLGDTWAYSTGNWSLVANSGPDERSAPGMTWNAAGHDVLLFGGTVDNKLLPIRTWKLG